MLLLQQISHSSGVQLVSIKLLDCRESMRFYPPDSHVPERLETADFILRPLLAKHVELDYDAVMEDPASLRAWSQSDWPADDFTLQENLRDLERHEREHRERAAFTFTVLSTVGDRCLGCVYISPIEVRIAAGQIPDFYRPGPQHFTADVCFWVRPSQFSIQIDIKLFHSVQSWLMHDWYFDRLFIHTSQADLRQREILAWAGCKEIAQFVSEAPRPGGWVIYKML